MDGDLGADRGSRQGGGTAPVVATAAHLAVTPSPLFQAAAADLPCFSWSLAQTPPLSHACCCMPACCCCCCCRLTFELRLCCHPLHILLRVLLQAAPLAIDALQYAQRQQQTDMQQRTSRLANTHPAALMPPAGCHYCRLCGCRLCGCAQRDSTQFAAAAALPAQQHH